MVWERFKRNNYSISDKDKKEFTWHLQEYLNSLNELITKYGFVKQCSKCLLEIPRTSKFFYKDRKAKDGLRPECKQCYKKARKIAYHGKKERVLHSEISYKKTDLKSTH